jgi:hypothetical protein
MKRKKCKRCEQVKDYSKFYNHRTTADGKQQHCISCNAAMKKELKVTNPKKHKRDQKNRYLKSRYGITIDRYDAMYEQQEGKCAICRAEDSDQFAVDHCHKTGKVRGLLCRSCNLGIGQLKDDIEVLSNAITYLQWRGVLNDRDRI